MPRNREIAAFLERLARQSRHLAFDRLGRSARGRTIAAVRASRDGVPVWDAGAPDSRLRVMIVGSQHGRETSGAEALQMLARDLADGAMAPSLRTLDLLMVPCANPDGRDQEHQTNGNQVNLNSDYVLLSQPESRAIAAAIGSFRPYVLLDVHESSTLKRRTLGREGYLTDFEAQFDPASHPAIDDDLRRLGIHSMLPRVLAAVDDAGLPAQRYVGEIDSIKSAITHGSLSARKLRNYAGLQGVLAFVLENRLDRSDLTFPTPRNIAVRTRKQYESVVAFLETCAAQGTQIVAAAEAAQRTLTSPPEGYRLPVTFDYDIDRRRPKITLGYRRLHSGRRVQITQPYRGRIAVTRRIALPRAIAVTRHQRAIARVLDHHGIRYAVLHRPQPVRAIRLQPAGPDDRPAFSAAPRAAPAVVPPGALWIGLDQATGRLAALLLDPRSGDALFHAHPYRRMLEDGLPCCILPVTAEL